MLRALILPLIVLPVAVMTAWVIGVLTLSVFVPILVPVAIGTCAGVGLGFTAHLLGIQNRGVLVVVALGAWVAAMGTLHWVEYRRGFVEAVRAENALESNAAGDPGYTDEEALALSDELLQDVVGREGFLGFLELRARGGMNLRGAPGARLDGWAALALWLVDLLACLAMILRIGWGAQARLRLSRATGSRYNVGPSMDGGTGGG